VNRITHLDADAFFASVEQASDPRLRGRPVAVGGEKRGIIASASYEARKFGVYTPMPTVRARRLCPRLVVLPGDFEKYERFSRWMFSYAYDFTPDVEVTSIDEGYFDLTGVRRDAVEVARTIREAIRGALKITVSEGLGSNKLVSQVASKLFKPAGFHVVPVGGETAFLHPLSNQWLPGVGPKTSGRLNAAGLVRVGQVGLAPLEMLELLVGSAAPGLRRFANGIDERPIIPASEPAKSYSQQETFGQDQTDEGYIEATLRRMADELFAKVRADGKAVRTLTVKVRYNDMAEDQSGESLAEPTDLETEVYGRLTVLLRQAWKRRVSLRLVSLKLSNLYEGVFCSELALGLGVLQTDARRRLARVVDELRRERGRYVILRGHDFALREGGGEGGPATAGPGAGADGKPPRSRAVRWAHDPGSVHGEGERRAVSAERWVVGVKGRRGDVGKRVDPVPLLVRSYFSFMNSTLSPEAVVEWAKRLGYSAVAMCDQGNLHGAVRFVQAARELGVRPVLGAELMVRGRPLWLYVENATGYANLCRLLSGNEEGRMKNRPNGGSDPFPHRFPILHASLAGLVAVSSDAEWAGYFPGRFYLGVDSVEGLRGMAKPWRWPCVWMQPVHYARPDDRWKFEILQSVRTLTLLRQAHPEKVLGAEWHWESAAGFGEWFKDYPELAGWSRELAERCGGFELPLGPPQFPAFRPPDGSSAREYLRRLVFEGMERRYGNAEGRRQKAEGGEGRCGGVRAQIEMELEIIHEVGYEEYFLVVWDILQECRRRGIGWITRGSAADSLVCYCLGISGVCPIRFDLYFRRFLNRERMALNKLPDIDVDFPHDRKDDVVDLIFEKYGAEQCAVVGGFSTFQARSAFAEVAKVLGVAEREVRRFTEHFPWSFAREPGVALGAEGPSGKAAGSSLEALLRSSPECRDLPLDEEPYRSALVMAEFLDGVPRYPKMHPCGVVLSRQPMHELTPTFLSSKGYPTTHFDMDAVEAMGLVKIDVLAQGGLAVMRDVEEMLREHGVRVDVERCVVEGGGQRGEGGGRPVRRSSQSEGGRVETLFGDGAVWEMIASGGGRAVHHIESPAMISLCRMTNVREIDGLIAIVSVIRPGAANEQKKLKFTRRYQGLELPEYPDPSLAGCLRSTFGLVVYEEHILQICEAFAGLDPGRADVLRRALVKRKWGVVAEIGREFAVAARGRGHGEEKIGEVWDLVVGFNGYAFCKAHSTAYGVEAYQSAWLKRYFPAEFMAAVLTNGKGFYAPLVYVLECHRLGIRLRPPCVNRPGPGYRVEYEGGRGGGDDGDGRGPAPGAGVIRVPVSRIKGLGERMLERLYRERARGEFVSMADFYARLGPLSEEMELLIRAGALDGLGESRTRQFWEAQVWRHRFGRGASGQGWLLPVVGEGLSGVSDEGGWGTMDLTEPARRQRLEWEAELLGYAASGHPLELYDGVAWETYCPVARLDEHVGEEVVACGLVIEERVHHQVTGEPMKFLTLCDWTGMVETELFAPTYRVYGLATVRYPVLEITARVEAYENGRGYTLRVLRAGKPRMKNG
jgi:DNA-directed DNA polymerase III PolC